MEENLILYICFGENQLYYIILFTFI